MKPWTLTLGPKRVRPINVPQFRVGASFLTELHLDVPCGSSDATQFVEQLRTDIVRTGRRLVDVDAFNPRGIGLLGRLRSGRLVDRLARMEKISREVTIDVLRCCGVEPEQKADLIPWTDRMLISLELAVRRADVVVVHSIGLDGTGEQRLLDHLRTHLHKGLAVVALEYPRVRGGPYPSRA